MLCPEVLNAKCGLKTETQVNTWKSFNCEETKKKRTKFTKSELLESIQIFLPNTLRVPDSILSTLTNDSHFYKVERKFQLETIFEESFINNFVKKGKLNIASVGDLNENHVSLNPDGTLSLTLNNQLGETNIQLKSFFTKAQEFNSSQTVFQLNLCKVTLKKSRRDEIKECLKHISITSPVVICWESPDVSVCPSSVASFLEDSGMEVTVATPVLEQLRSYNLVLPLVDNDIYTDWDTEHLKEVEDWMGAVSLGADLDDEGADCPQPSQECGQMAIIKLSGFTTSQRVLDVVGSCSEFLSSREDIPWVGVVGLGCTGQILERSTRPVLCTETGVTVFAVRNGQTVVKQTQTIDYSP